MGEVDTGSCKILVHSVTRDGLGIPEPQSSADSAYNTYMPACGELVGSLLEVADLNYVGHRECVFGASEGARKEREYSEMAELARQKYLVVGQKVSASTG